MYVKLAEIAAKGDRWLERSTNGERGERKEKGRAKEMVGKLHSPKYGCDIKAVLLKALVWLWGAVNNAECNSFPKVLYNSINIFNVIKIKVQVVYYTQSSSILA